MPIHQQWKKFSDPDLLKCSQGNLLLQKNDGTPACVKPFTYEKLIDRGYGKFDSSQMSKRPEMMNQLMNHMISNENLMHHWHQMLQKNPSLMMQTTNYFTTLMKENPELLKNVLGSMTSEPELREKMIQTMKHHSLMEASLKQNSMWMDSVHQPMMGSMGHGGDSDIGCPMCEKMSNTSCSWCPEYQMHSMHKTTTFSHSERMMDMIHEMWINSDTSNQIHRKMLENPSHMALMSQDMMEPLLNAVMDDEQLRQEMIDLMLEHEVFMNTIRHENPSDQH
ncbi:hypothetical protein [Nitrosopumilus sp. S4]